MKGEIENLTIDPQTDEVTSPMPKCPGCGEISRPTVLMFGDWGVLYDGIAEQESGYQAWKKEQAKNPDLHAVVIEIGAGVAIPTVRHESESLSRKFKCPLIRINPEHPETKGAEEGIEHISILSGAEDALRGIDAELKKL